MEDEYDYNNDIPCRNTTTHHVLETVILLSPFSLNTPFIFKRLHSPVRQPRSSLQFLLLRD